ncbi:MAG TPA: hypothetical protein VNB24_00290 [Acidimicrobiales bacterium]|nr:hypothetical protein [Acidimicrobiales bacterium]
MRVPFLEVPAGTLRRIPQLLVGLFLCGLGDALMIDAGLGLGPWDVLHQGISRHTGIPIGMVVILVGVVLFLGWIPLRQRIGVGTVLNVILIGLTIDLLLLVPFEPSGLFARGAALLVGDVLLAAGAGIYIGAGLGTGPRDGLMTGLVARGLPLRTVRTAMELTVLVFGWLLGGTVGVGTILFALSIGPILHEVLKRCDRGQLVSETTEGDLDAATSGA